MGDITNKNNLLFAPSTEALAATKHANGKDIWIMTHEFNTNRFFTYKIDDTLGLITTPVISSIGAYIDYFATIKFSPNGKKLLIVQPTSLFDFDNLTGYITNVINLNTYSIGYYYGVFSPDNSKLYFTLSSSSSDVLQYCLTGNNDSASISNTFVWLTNPLDITGQYGQMSIGKDGKIYIANLWQDSIGVISNPNQYGSQCNILPRSISLGGKLCELGINNFTGSYFYDSTLIPQNCDSTTGVFDNTTSSVFYVYPNPATDQVNIKINNTEKEDIEIKLYDLMTVQKGYYKLSSNTYDATLQLPDIAAGIYIIEFRMGEKNLRQKLCIIR